MNLKEYINSGIIEDYCLGVLNPIEMRTVARHAELYQEIEDAINISEAVLKKYAEELDIDQNIDIRKYDILCRLLKKMKNI